MTPPVRHVGRRQRSRATRYITLDTRACEACWQFLEACPNEVLGRVAIGRLHRHARIAVADACTGCLACARVCEAGALTCVDR